VHIQPKTTLAEAIYSSIRSDYHTGVLVSCNRLHAQADIDKAHTGSGLIEVRDNLSNASSHNDEVRHVEDCHGWQNDE
jgi:hypothetical protein